jgi:hypothetical protein
MMDLRRLVAVSFREGSSKVFSDYTQHRGMKTSMLVRYYC